MNVAVNPFDRVEKLLPAGFVVARFRKFNVEFPRQERELLVENRIWFSDISKLDDIYEGRPLFEWDDRIPTRDDLRAMARRRASPTWSEKRKERFVETQLRNLEHPEYVAKMRAGVEEQTRALYAGSSVCCFFSNPTIQRHWAHYADDGSGYALLFDFSEPWRMRAHLGPTIPIVPLQVRYIPVNARRPTIKLSLARTEDEDSFSDIQNALLTKSAAWGEQDEIRLPRAGIHAGFVTFPATSLCAVVLGYNIDRHPDQKEALIQLVRTRRTPVAIYRATPSDVDYTIQLRPMVL